jgi:hypothetical protein
MDYKSIGKIDSLLQPLEKKEEARLDLDLSWALVRDHVSILGSKVCGKVMKA